MKKYILTGGPGTGKSTILTELGNLGEYTIDEAAEFFIRMQKSKGINEPWKLPGFQEKILEIQLRWESEIPEYVKRVFIDRGIPDGLAYATPHTKTYKKILDEAKKTQYEKIFLIENLGFTEKTEIRRENLEESKKLEKIMEKIYKAFGYDPIRIPPLPIEQRLELILQHTDYQTFNINSTQESATMGGKK